MIPQSPKATLNESITTSTLLATQFTVESVRIDPVEGSVTYRDGTTRQILRKQLEVFAELLVRRGETVSRTELVSAVWGGNGLIGDRGVTDAVYGLRKLFSHRHPPLIRTIHRHGYLLTHDVRIQLHPVCTVASDSRMSIFGPRGFYWLLAGGISVLAFTLILYSGAPLSDIGPPRYPVAATPVSTHEGSTQTPAVSPDGRRLAYAARDSGHPYSIHIEPLDGTDGGLVIEDVGGHDLYQPAFAPDGSKLAYLRRRESGDEFPKHDVILRNLQTGDTTQVGRVTGVYRVFPGLDWSDDGRFLLYCDSHEDFRPAIVRLDLATMTETRLTAPTFADILPRFIPGSSSDFSFVRLPDPGSSDIYAFVNGELRRITHKNSYIKGHAWIDAKRFVASVYERSEYRGLEGHLENPDLYDLGFDPGFQYPVYGARKLFYVQSHVTVGIGLAQLQSEEDRIFLAPLGNYRGDASIHPLDNLIAYADDRTGVQEIWVSRLDGSEARQITRSGKRLIQPKWSPDGGRLVALIYDNTGPSPRPVLIDPASSSITELVSGDGGYGWATFNQEATAIITTRASEGHAEIWWIPLDSPERARTLFRIDEPLSARSFGGKVAVKTSDKAYLIDPRNSQTLPVTQAYWDRIVEVTNDGYQWLRQDNSIKLIRTTTTNYPDSEELLAIENGQVISGGDIDPGRRIVTWNQAHTHRLRIYGADFPDN